MAEATAGRAQSLRQPALAAAAAAPNPQDLKKARKRELDRNAQQKKRKRDRELIQKLEARLRLLQQPVGDRCVDQLLLEREKDLARFQRHLQRSKQIQALLQADMEDIAEAQNAQLIPDAGEQQQHNTCPTTIARDVSPIPESVNMLGDVLATPDPLFWSDSTSIGGPPNDGCLPALSFGEMSTLGSDAISFAHELVIATPSTSECGDLMDWPMRTILSYDANAQAQDLQSGNGCGNLFTKVNDLLYMARNVTSNDIQCLDEIDAHILVTGIIQGWDRARKSISWDQQWEYISRIDEVKFANSCSEVDRLVMCRMLRKVLKSQAAAERGATKPLPEFMKPRPSQLQVPHPVIADYFVWPGFREQLVFNHNAYSTDHFATVFAAGFRFLWPFEVRDMYIRNVKTQMYQFSPSFLERADNLQYYTMESSFITQYPEFRGDCPMFSSVPPDIAMDMCGDLGTILRQQFPHYQLATIANDSTDSASLEEDDNP